MIENLITFGKRGDKYYIKYKHADLYIDFIADDVLLYPLTPHVYGFYDKEVAENYIKSPYVKITSINTRTMPSFMNYTKDNHWEIPSSEFEIVKIRTVMKIITA